jgi:LDH2 family malate/lactate/ureidoglycolate dehydrogenase
MVRIRNYFDSIDNGAIVPDAEPVVVRDNRVAVLMDGNKAFGQVAASKAMNLAVERARKQALGVVSFTDVYHIGRLGEYAASAADQGFVSLILANGSRPGGLVAPYGGRERMLGTNPIAFAVPAGTHPALVADFSTSAISEGRVRIAKRMGEALPADWVIDTDGRPSNDASTLYDGGAILPFGDYKGYALSLLVEVLGGILSGAETPVFPEYKYMHNGVLMIALDPTYFRPATEYRESVDFFFSRIKNTLPALGMEGALIPGEPELRRKEIREREGIPIDAHTWAELCEVGARWNVDLVNEQPAHAGGA